MKYSVTHADLSGIQGVLTCLWKTALPLRGDAEARFRWYYLDNPHGKGEVFLLSFKNSAGNEEFVGCAGVGPRSFYFRDNPSRVALLADFATAKDHRTVFPALTLQRGVRDFCKGNFDFAIGFPSASAAGVFKRIGYREIGKMQRYVRILRHEPYVRRLVPNPLAARVAGMAMDIVGSTRCRMRTARAPDSLQVEWLRTTDPRFDALWREVHGAYRLLGYRGAGFLQWRFLDRPDRDYEVAALVHAGSGRLHAYTVIEAEDDHAHIRDFLAQSPEDLGILLDRLAPALRTRRFVCMSVRFLGAKWVTTLLEAHGFGFREALQAVVMDPGDLLSGDSASLLVPENWYLTDGDVHT